MFKSLIGAATALTLLATASPALARNSDDELGKGDFFVFVPPIKNKDGVMPRFTTADFDALKPIYDACVTQAKMQMPSELKTVSVTFIRNVPGAVAGAVIGSKIGNFVPKRGVLTAWDYGVYTGFSVAGSSIGAGFTSHAVGKQSTVGGCMVASLNTMHRMGELRHVQVAYNVFPVRGKPIKRSSLPAPTTTELEAAPKVQTLDDVNTAAPPPVIP